jgi:hypothetical protein
MESDWGTLRSAGVPDGPARPVPRAPIDVAAVRSALARIAEAPGPIDACRGEALLAWVCAFRHHWPTAYEDVVGSSGGRLEAKLQSVCADTNRHLKLRRIAIENLARVV